MISIIIVNYHVKKELFECVKSIISTNPKTPYEIIVVDNDEEKTILNDLHKKFPKIKYIPNKNKGFGQGNNVGAKQAKGEYLFFLNPDTKFLNNCLDILIAYLKKNKVAAISAPLLFDNKNKPYPLQGILNLTPLRAIFALSFINKVFPNNKIYQDYYLFDWNKKSIKEVDAVPGTAFIIKKEVFEKADGFDENFFLYFEEFDLCKRVKELGWKIFILPTAKVFHVWGSSTKKHDTKKIFLESRYYYFKKHFGTITAIITEAILRINKYSLLLSGIIVLGLFLRTHNLTDTMTFIGDQAWFYISARDLLLTGNIPLVGIPSSHPWLHQGALWTYALAFGLKVFSFSPPSGAYLSVLIDLIAIFLIYKVGSSMFTQKLGVIAAALYATSPLVVISARMPYHTSPIPLMTIIFIYFLYIWVSGNKKAFPLIIASLAILYNLEIATFILAIVFFLILAYGALKKTSWFRKIISLKIIIASLFAFIIPMIPMFIHDINHEFSQTIKFIAWLGYKVLLVFGYPPLHPEIQSPGINEILVFLAIHFQRLIYAPSSLVAFILGVFSIGFFYKSIIPKIKFNKNNISIIVLALIFSVSLVGFIIVGVPSSAYLPIFFAPVILLTALFFERLMNNKKLGYKLTLLLLSLIVFGNSYYLISHNYSFDMYLGQTLKVKIDIAKSIIRQSTGREYNLIGTGPSSQFKSFTMNYEYLTWWLGHGPSDEQQKLQFIINDEDGTVNVNKIE